MRLTNTRRGDALAVTGREPTEQRPHWRAALRYASASWGVCPRCHRDLQVVGAACKSCGEDRR